MEANDSNNNEKMPSQPKVRFAVSKSEETSNSPTKNEGATVGEYTHTHIYSYCIMVLYWTQYFYLYKRYNY